MKLIEALNLQKAVHARNGEDFRCFLAAGIHTLHLRTFLIAEIGLLLPGMRIKIQEGLFGDLSGNIGLLAASGCDFGIVAIEWSDLDARLGTRSSARWSQETLADIAETVKVRLRDLEQQIIAASQRAPVALSLPTLPLPPFSFVPESQSGQFQVDLQSGIHALEAALVRIPQVRLISRQKVDFESPLQDRHDAHADLTSGFPYKLHHASVLAFHLARLVRGPVPKKGLITDLDNTLWKGILGEDGVQGVSWDLDHGSQAHAYYQRLLGALTSEGVMIAIASKNERALVEEALQRGDLALSPQAIFPVEAHWEAKSSSVARILAAWNVGPEAVVFVDDSPFELEEVKAAFPQITCLQFPAGDDQAICALAFALRDHFGKSAIREEDILRLDSLRGAQAAAASRSELSPSGYLQNLEAEVSFNFSKDPIDPRALELVNKTNQFNLNGKRYTESSWSRIVSDPGRILIVASYRDKFGPLGKISVLLGTLSDRRLRIDAWVMSCRAFSRQIEHKCLAELLDRFDIEEIAFDYLETERNKPLQDFLAQILGAPARPDCTIERTALEERLTPFINVQEAVDG